MTSDDAAPAGNGRPVEAATAVGPAGHHEQTGRLEQVLRIALVVLGVAAIARGITLVLFVIKPAHWIPIGIWLAAGSGVHDLLIAPASLLLGRVLRRPLRIPLAGNAIRGAWLGIGTVLLVGLPLVVGAGHRTNPTVIPSRPVLNLFLSLALVLAGAATVIGVSQISFKGRHFRK
jgi:hypothetical protein